MAHAAKIVNGIVTQVIVVDNDKLSDGGEFSSRNEILLNEYLEDIGIGGEWRLTSYNDNFRGLFAGVGMTYGQAPGESAGVYEFLPAQIVADYIRDRIDTDTADIKTEEE
tara:strand:+ start:475 stop:804 length:330 start_codon:yes stop_codon:yes gene_type:complete